MKWLILGGISLVGVLLVPWSAEAAMKVFTSDGVIQDGDYFYGVEIRDTPPGHTTVDMTGGSVEQPGMFTYDQSVLNVSGGFVYNLESRDSSTVNFIRGTVERDLVMYGNSCVNVYDIWFDWVSLSGFYIGGSSTANVFGGFVGAITAAGGSSTLNVYGGELNGLSVGDMSTTNIYGGRIGSNWGSYVEPSATVNIYGYGFQYDPQAWWDGTGRISDGWVSELTGFGFDGTPIGITAMPDPSANPNINLIPEPATVIFVGLGAIGLLTKRRHRVSW